MTGTGGLSGGFWKLARCTVPASSSPIASLECRLRKVFAASRAAGRCMHAAAHPLRWHCVLGIRRSHCRALQWCVRRPATVRARNIRARSGVYNVLCSEDVALVRCCCSLYRCWLQSLAGWPWRAYAEARALREQKFALHTVAGTGRFTGCCSCRTRVCSWDCLVAAPTWHGTPRVWRWAAHAYDAPFSASFSFFSPKFKILWPLTAAPRCSCLLLQEEFVDFVNKKCKPPKPPKARAPLKPLPALTLPGGGNFQSRTPHEVENVLKTRREYLADGDARLATMAEELYVQHKLDDHFITQQLQLQQQQHDHQPHQQPGSVAAEIAALRAAVENVASTSLHQFYS